MARKQLRSDELVPFLRGQKSKSEINDLFLQNAGYRHNEVNDVLRGDMPVRIDQGLDELDEPDEAPPIDMESFNRFVDQGGIDEEFLMQVIDRARELGRNELADELEAMLGAEDGEVSDS